MGGISAGYFNYSDINFKNPASLGILNHTTFDVGAEVDIRTLKSTSSNNKYTSTNSLFSYIQVAFPLTSPKMRKKNMDWGLSFGLRPITRIGYKIEKNERLTGIDSLNTLYEGSGGVNQANVSTGLRIRTSPKSRKVGNYLSIGVSSGYTFGNKDFSTQKIFVNDTVAYYKSNTQAVSHFGGIFFNAGLQYEHHFLKGEKDNTKSSVLTIGTYASFQQNLRARQDKVNETFGFNSNGEIIAIDTVTFDKEAKGTVTLPATYGIGFTYQDKNEHWLVGADFEMTNWKSYRYYGEQDAVQNSWTARMGAQYLPAKKGVNKYLNFVKYRAGFYFGPDYVKLDKTRFNYAGTLGASFPLTTSRSYTIRDFVFLNTAVEIGGRGNNSSFSFKENNLRFSFGISMNAFWFQKRNYY